MNTRQQNGSSADGRGVLITGCSSGIGQATAVKSAEHGFTVFATVQKEADAENLRNLNMVNLVPVCPVDLTNLDHITNAAKIVTNELNRRDKNGLYALINNAGAVRQRLSN
ncbi:MAG: SDR family NAD(P)-dependent oxidoreductase [Anaerolineales bacterium]